MAKPSCKFCGSPCEPKEYRDIELDMCGHCWSQWKRIARGK